MRKKLFEFDKHSHTGLTAEKLLEKATKEEKKQLLEFKEYNKEAIAEILRFREVTGVNLLRTELKDEQYFMNELKTTTLFGETTKNKIRGVIRKWLRFIFSDWRIRFNGFEDIKFNSEAKREKEIDESLLFSKEEIELLMKAEETIFYKTFLIVQYEGGLRTGEARALEWNNVVFDDDFCYIKVSSKKNRHSTPKFREIPLKEATYFLRELKKDQERTGINSKWVFPSSQDISEHISKQVNKWFKRLVKRVLNKDRYNYLLRHSRGTELQRLIKNNQTNISNATEFLGHSEKMFNKVYSHMDNKEKIELMKKQFYNFKYLPPEKKHELELKIDDLLKRQEKTEKKQEITQNLVIGLLREIKRLKLGQQ